MNRILKTIIFSAAVAATTLSALPAAQAGDGWRRHYKHRGNDNTGEILAAGALGLVAGALIAGGTRSQPVYNDYYEPPVRARPYREYYRPAPRQRVVYSDGYSVEPWTPEWYDYCSSRYRSFNARTGTFTGYDGVQRFCAAN